MNIFAIYDSPIESAIYLVDKHVVKMPLETAQLLCNAFALNNSHKLTPYKHTHLKHPCSIWASESEENYDWLCLHGLELCNEYSERYDKIHKSQNIINWCCNNRPKFSKKTLSTFACAMPDLYKISQEPTLCYQEYYRVGKKHLHSWKNNNIPPFL